MKIFFNDLKSQWDLIKDECHKKFDILFEKSNFILGDFVEEFEKKFAEYIGCKYAIGVSNGTDAIKLAAKSLKLCGKTLTIIPANTFIATILGMEEGLDQSDFILIDCDKYHQINVDILEDTISKNRDKYDNIIIVPVHLYGYTCNMKAITDIAIKYDCLILEDASQAHGAKYDNKTVGSFGIVSAFSLYPGKNLGAAGDAGIITTNDENIYNSLLYLRNIGSIKKYEHIVKGYNHRLDSIQAIILSEKMKYIEEWNENRRKTINKILKNVSNINITLPMCPEKCVPIHHIFPVIVENRNNFQNYLDTNNIQHGIHYPILIEETSMYNYLCNMPNQIALYFSKHMISLPIHPFMKEEEINFLCDKLNNYEG